MADSSNLRTDGSRRYDAVVEQCRGLISGFCDARLAELFKNAGSALLDFAERAESNAVQTRFFEAISQLNRRRPDMERTFRQEIAEGFDRLGHLEPVSREETHSPPLDAAEMTLIEPDEMEESVAAENLVLRANASHFPELYALSQRLAVVNDGKKLKDHQIPGGPHHLVGAYRHAISGLDVDARVKVILYALFDRFVLKFVKPTYEEYNRILVAAGILPNLKTVHLRQDGKDGQASKDAAPAPDAQAQQGADLGRSQDIGAAPGPAGDPQAQSLGAELFDSILDIMSTRRPARRGDRSRPAPTFEEAGIQTRELLSAITSIQSNRTPDSVSTAVAEATRFPTVEVDTEFVARVKNALSQEREQVLRSVDQDKLSPVDADLIDLIGMLFEYMLNDPVLPNVAKALLSHLHTPYLKVALIDRRLLVDSRHPARVLLDKMVEAGSLWVEEGNPTRGMFPAMQRIVDRVLQEFTDNVSLFDELLAFFDEKMREQQRRSDTMEQRTQEAARGREKLALAKQRAAAEIQRLVSRYPIPRPVAGFLSKTWLDHLVFILLRDEEQERGNTWKQAVAIAEQLVALFDPQSSAEHRRTRMANLPRLRKAIAEAAERTGSLSSTTTASLLNLLDTPQNWPSQAMERPEIPVPQPAAGIVPAGSAVPVLASSTADEDLTEPEREMVERLRKMRFGTWFALASPGGDEPVKRVKLSWMSPLTSTCMFVDRSGMQAEIKTLRDLAQEILAGRAKVIPRPKHPFIDRALVSIRKMLQTEADGEPGTVRSTA